jgi:hypothetical protein
MWFRRDLRVDDHPALAAAAARGEVVALWVADPALLNAPHHRAPVRQRFLRACLEALDAQLRDLGIALVVREGDPVQVVPAVAAEAGADRVVVTDDVTPYSRRRDAAVADARAPAGVAFEAIGGPWRVPLDHLAGSSGNGYLVFTPFFKAWDQVPVSTRIAPPAALAGPELPSDGLGALPTGEPLIAAGPVAARARLEAFIRSGHADAYADGRDDLAADATSHLSADLRMGVLSPAQVGRAIGADGFCQLQGTLQRDAVNDAVDQAHFISALRRDEFTGQGKLQGKALRDLAGQADKAARGCGQTALHFGDTELGILIGDDQVTGERDFKATGQRIAINSRDQRFGGRRFGKARKALAGHMRCFTGQKALQVHARTESATSARDDANAQIIVAIQPIHCRSHAFGERLIGSVLGFWAVERDNQNIATDFGQDGIGHDRLPLFADGPAASGFTFP